MCLEYYLILSKKGSVTVKSTQSLELTISKCNEIWYTKKCHKCKEYSKNAG